MKTSTNIVKGQGSHDLDLSEKQRQERIRLIKNMVASEGTTNDELSLFLYYANRTGLDPLARQIYIITRGRGEKRKASIMASIDGLRIVAERSGVYAGQDEPVFVERPNGIPEKCTIRVYKFAPDGTRYCAAIGLAYWDEYVPGDGQDFMWKKMPHTMLAKVAEALALRKAFPNDLSGLYTGEEMQQSDKDNAQRSIEAQASIEVMEQEKDVSPQQEEVDTKEEKDKEETDGGTVQAVNAALENEAESPRRGLIERIASAPDNETLDKLNEEIASIENIRKRSGLSAMITERRRMLSAEKRLEQPHQA